MGMFWINALIENNNEFGHPSQGEMIMAGGHDDLWFNNPEKYWTSEEWPGGTEVVVGYRVSLCSHKNVPDRPYVIIRPGDGGVWVSPIDDGQSNNWGYFRGPGRPEYWAFVEDGFILIPHREVRKYVRRLLESAVSKAKSL